MMLHWGSRGETFLSSSNKTKMSKTVRMVKQRAGNIVASAREVHFKASEVSFPLSHLQMSELIITKGLRVGGLPTHTGTQERKWQRKHLYSEHWSMFIVWFSLALKMVSQQYFLESLTFVDRKYHSPVTAGWQRPFPVNLNLTTCVWTGLTHWDSIFYNSLGWGLVPSVGRFACV